jgi:hypothetical protein
LAAGMNAGIGFDKGLAQSAGRAGLCVFAKGMGNYADGQFTGQFPDCMRAHPVGHQEDMTSRAPLIVIPSQQDGVIVLVMAATDTYIT